MTALSTFVRSVKGISLFLEVCDHDASLLSESAVVLSSESSLMSVDEQALWYILDDESKSEGEARGPLDQGSLKPALTFWKKGLVDVYTSAQPFDSSSSSWSDDQFLLLVIIIWQRVLPMDWPATPSRHCGHGVMQHQDLMNGDSV